MIAPNSLSGPLAIEYQGRQGPNGYYPSNSCVRPLFYYVSRFLWRPFFFRLSSASNTSFLVAIESNQRCFVSLSLIIETAGGV